jgi:NitT/TauT family transport system permease protein
MLPPAAVPARVADAVTQIHPTLDHPEEQVVSTRPAWWIDALLLAGLVALVYGIVNAASHWVAPLTPTVNIDLSPRSLPRYAGLSTLRMALAYLLALVFSLAYARIAAGNRSAERVMIPILDILQSIPILSFLPGVVLALVAIFPNSNLGLELAAILLIFTSQAWNMAFSFHQSLITIPQDLREAAALFRLNWWRKFRRLEVPFGTIPLIWNSMMSWAGGWFFLMAAEQFTLGNHNFQLPGLGSYLQTAANAGNISALLMGLATLIIIIVLLDQFLWRPLIAWSDRFKIEMTSGGEEPTSFVLKALQRSTLVEIATTRLFQPASQAIDAGIARLSGLGSSGGNVPEGQRSSPWSRGRISGIIVSVILLAAFAAGFAGALHLLINVTPSEWATVGVSALASLLRTGFALVLGVAWTVPVGVAIGTNPRWAQRAQPVVQMVASIPATALFPALLLILLGLPGGLNVAAVALMLLGTQWYILFNVIAGAMAIPSDLREAATVYRLRGWLRWKSLILPAIFPFLVTGMITATGGAWNATIVSEYVTFNGQVVSTVGLGALIAKSAANGNYALLLASTLAMAAVVITINRLIWHRMYRLAEQRFHLD